MVRYGHGVFPAVRVHVHRSPVLHHDPSASLAFIVVWAFTAVLHAACASIVRIVRKKLHVIDDGLRVYEVMIGTRRFLVSNVDMASIGMMGGSTKLSLPVTVDGWSIREDFASKHWLQPSMVVTSDETISRARSEHGADKIKSSGLLARLETMTGYDHPVLRRMTGIIPTVRRSLRMDARSMILAPSMHDDPRKTIDPVTDRRNRLDKISMQIEDCRRIAVMYGIDDGSIDFLEGKISDENWSDDKRLLARLERSVKSLHETMVKIDRDRSLISDGITAVNEYNDRIHGLLDGRAASPSA
jgi:hypothetical protein